MPHRRATRAAIDPHQNLRVLLVHIRHLTVWQTPPSGDCATQSRQPARSVSGSRQRVCIRLPGALRRRKLHRFPQQPYNLIPDRSRRFQPQESPLSHGPFPHFQKLRFPRIHQRANPTLRQLHGQTFRTGEREEFPSHHKRGTVHFPLDGYIRPRFQSGAERGKISALHFFPAPDALNRQGKRPAWPRSSSSPVGIRCRRIPDRSGRG